MYLEDRALYREDWIGLKTLDQAGKLSKIVLEGRHMNITNETVVEFAEKYLGTILPETEETGEPAADAVQEAMSRFGKSFYDRLQIFMSAMSGQAYI